MRRYPSSMDPRLCRQRGDRPPQQEVCFSTPLISTHSPLLTRYFFHATTARKETEEYDIDASGTEDEQEPPASPPTSVKNQTTEASEEKEIEVDPSMAEWFDLGANSKSGMEKGGGPGSDSETEPEPDEPEPDSENEDVRDDIETPFEEDDDWEQVGKESETQTSTDKVRMYCLVVTRHLKKSNVVYVQGYGCTDG